MEKKHPISLSDAEMYFSIERLLKKWLTHLCQRPAPAESDHPLLVAPL
jgi:hypothetical protein